MHLAVLLLLLTLPAEEAPCCDVLWLDEERTTPIYLAPRLLFAAERDPRVSEEIYNVFLASLKRQQESGQGCTEVVSGLALLDEPGEPKRLSIAQLMTQEQVAVLGRVERVTPGWSPIYKHVVSLVEVKISKVYHDTEGIYSPNDRFTFLQRAGNLKIGEIELCTIYRPFPLMVPGDSVIVVGRHAQANGQHISTNAFSVFPVVDDRVVVLRDPLELSWELNLGDVDKFFHQ